MGDRETRRRDLSNRLSRILPRADAQALVEAVMNPDDAAPRLLAEVVWDALAPEVRIALGGSLARFLDAERGPRR